MIKRLKGVWMLPFPESILKAQAAPGDRAGMHALGEGRKLEALHDYLYNGIVKRKLALLFFFIIIYNNKKN